MQPDRRFFATPDGIRKIAAIMILVFAFVTVIAPSGAVGAVLVAYPNPAAADPTQPIPW
jgi:hypothetical protein